MLLNVVLGMFFLMVAVVYLLMTIVAVSVSGWGAGTIVALFFSILSVAFSIWSFIDAYKNRERKVV
jgi:hypothetical protein